MAETINAGASGSSSTPATARKSRGANPSVDYKSLFLKSKDKYDQVSSDHTDLITNVTKATAKQQKLREELDYLLDAVASKRAQRARIEQSHRDRAFELEREAAAEEAARRHASSMARRDLSRERDIQELRRMSRGYEPPQEDYRPYSARYAAPPTAEPSYPAFGSGLGQRRITPPSLPSQSPPSRRRSQVLEPHTSPSRYETHQRYRESTPPLASSSTAGSVKRPRPVEAEHGALKPEDGYDMDPRAKRARND